MIRKLNFSPRRPRAAGAHYASTASSATARRTGGEAVRRAVGKCYAEARGLSVVAVRIGWVRPEANLPQDVPHQRGPGSA